MRLIAITTPAVAEALAKTGGRAGGEALSTVTLNSLTAILAAETKKRHLLFASRRKQLNRLVEEQRVLEDLLAFGPLLPARPGQRIASEDDARALLAAHGDALTEAFAEFGKTVQYQITMEWTASPEAREMTAQNPVLEGPAAAIESLVAAARQGLRDLIEPHLRRACRDLLDLPLDTANMFSNIVVLVAADGVAALEAALEAIDGALPAPSRIRMIGPLPPVSFAAVTLTEVGPQDLSKASRALEIDLDSALSSEPGRLRRHYLELVMRHHPDLGGEVNPDIAENGARVGAAADAYKLLARYAKAARTMGRSRALLVDVVRQDQIGQRAA